MTDQVATVIVTDRELRVNALRALQQRAKMNSLGLPDGLYRFDLLPVPYIKEQQALECVSPETRRAPDGSESALEVSTEVEADHEIHIGDGLLLDRRDLNPAYISISYAEGFPTLPGGLPIWSRLPYEPDIAHAAFEAYVRQGNDGARQLFLLGQDLNEAHAQTLSELQDNYTIFYWHDRAKAFDLCRAAEIRKVREIRAVEAENDHYFLSSRLLEKAKLYFDKEDLIDNLTPKAALELLKTAVQLQRQSIGLNPTSVKPEDDGSGNTQSLEVILRNIAGHSHLAADEGLIIDDSEAAIERVLSDPESTALAQELIVKLNASSRR
ncbi:MAG: hypothetical protein V3S69_03565 [Dehalococcoidales bacterium]